MKNRLKYRNILLSVLLCMVVISACDNDDDIASSPISVQKIFLEDADSNVPDREVKYARLGQLLRIEGSGFLGLKRVYINGYSTYFNPVFVTDNSMLIRVSENTPTTESDPGDRNKIHFVKDATAFTYEFEIRASAPAITGVSHTMPLAGEWITVYGTGLYEVNRVVFPGNIEETSEIANGEDGESFMVKVPAGVSEDGGSLLIECANGGAYSPAYFNFKAGVILNFDGRGSQGSWGSSVSMIKPEDLESASVGFGNVSQGTYCAHRPQRIASFDAGKNRCSEVWTAGNGVDDWRGQLTPYIPASTPLSEVGFQFDIYVPEEWVGTGYLKICLQNGFNGGEWEKDSYNFVPWIVGKEVVPFKTQGWQTVTVPITKLYMYAEGDFTFEDVLTRRETASYSNFGFYFENSEFTLGNVTGNSSDETAFVPSATSVRVYSDNWRVVSLAIPSYSDFPEE
ncbi:MAG: glycan-binding surface protein [Tannerella sp.]|nr:glycan-binding surface protein [Tannerella sp.]